MIMAAAVKLKIKQQIAKTYASDPEKNECKHCVDFFAAQPAFADALKNEVQRLRQLQPMHPTLQRVPEANAPAFPTPESPWTGFLAVWQLGLEAIKGRSKMVAILEIAFSILDSFYVDQRSPLNIQFGLPGSAVADLSVMHIVGLGRSLAMKVIWQAVLDLKLTDAEMIAIAHVLASISVVTCVWEAAQTDTDVRFLALRAKFQVSESMRPDVCQLYRTFMDALTKQNVSDISAGLKRLIDTFNSQASVAGHRVSELEKQVLLSLPRQSPGFVTDLETHWNNFRTAESGVTMKFFSMEVFSLNVPADVSGIWAKILEPSPEKAYVCLRYLISVFLRNNKQQRQTAKKSSKIQASKLRVQDPILAWKTCCLWTHFADSVKKRVADNDFVNLERLFLTGCLDKEMQEKCKLLDEGICLDNFRFLQVYTGVEVAPEQLQDKEMVAEEQQEKASLNLFSVKLEREVKQWERYQTSLQEFHAVQKAAKVEFLRTQETKLKDWGLSKKCHVHIQGCNFVIPSFQDCVTAFTQKTFPTKALTGEDAVIPYVRNCSQDWADSLGKSNDDIYYIYLVDFASLGNASSRYLARACRIIGDALAAGAERTVSIESSVAMHLH